MNRKGTLPPQDKYTNDTNVAPDVASVEHSAQFSTTYESTSAVSYSNREKPMVK